MQKTAVWRESGSRACCPNLLLAEDPLTALNAHKRIDTACHKGWTYASIFADTHANPAHMPEYYRIVVHIYARICALSAYNSAFPQPHGHPYLSRVTVVAEIHM